MDTPLAGKRIVVTRSREQAAATCTRLTALGAAVIPFPTIQFVPLAAGTKMLQKMLQECDMSHFDWLLLTSHNAVLFFAPFLAHLPTIKIAVSGSKTAASLQQIGREPTIIPDAFVGESLVAALGDVAGQRILFPRAKQGRPEIVDLLHTQGALVEEVHLYNTIAAAPDPAAFAQVAQGVDCITFTSPTTVRYFIEMMRHRRDTIYRVPTVTTIACIGPVTAAAAEAHGFTVDILPETFTTDGLIAAIVQYYAP